MRVQDAESADLVLQRKSLRFELDSIGAFDIRPYVCSRSLLHVGVTKLQGDFRIAYGEAVNISDASPKDEGVAIEPHVGSVPEGDFPDTRPRIDAGVGDVPHIESLRCSAHELGEMTEAVDRGEAIGLQDQLGFEIMDLIQIFLLMCAHRTVL